MRLLKLQRQRGAGASAGVVARVTCSADRSGPCFLLQSPKTSHLARSLYAVGV